MYPTLLAQHPDEASTVVDYRYRTRAGAARNAEDGGYDGHAVRLGERPDRRRGHTDLGRDRRARAARHLRRRAAQWQYYLATGDTAWLESRGWPVLRGAATFWASRAEEETDGFHITARRGPRRGELAGRRRGLHQRHRRDHAPAGHARGRGARQDRARALDRGGRRARRAGARGARRLPRRTSGVPRLRRPAGQAGGRRAAHLPVGVRPGPGRRPVEPSTTTRCATTPTARR